jgi:hypothetical protein
MRVGCDMRRFTVAGISEETRICSTNKKFPTMFQISSFMSPIRRHRGTSIDISRRCGCQLCLELVLQPTDSGPKTLVLLFQIGTPRGNSGGGYL